MKTAVSLFIRRMGWAAVLAAACVSSWTQARADCPPSAQTPTPEQAQAGMKHARDRGFLWRVRKDGHSSYLYGTVHVAKSEWMYPGPTLLSALRASDVIALELDVMDPDIIERVRNGMAWRAERAAPAATAERLRAQVQAACLPDQLLSSVTPEMVATTLLVMAGRREGLEPAYAIDAVMAGLGRHLNKPVLSLETPEQQLQLVLGRTPQEGQAMVEQALDELESGRVAPTLMHIAQAWADGRWDELEHYEQWCGCVDTEEARALHRRLLDERNPQLAQRIDDLHRSGRKVFAAVGSLHMVGPRGLPALLAGRGYQVERIEFK